MKKNKKNRYIVVKLAKGETYDGTQTGKEFRSKPAAYDYVKLRGYGYCVAKLNKLKEGEI